MAFARSYGKWLNFGGLYVAVVEVIANNALFLICERKFVDAVHGLLSGFAFGALGVGFKV